MRVLHLFLPIPTEFGERSSVMAGKRDGTRYENRMISIRDDEFHQTEAPIGNQRLTARRTSMEPHSPEARFAPPPGMKIR